MGAAGAALRYVKETQKSAAGHVDRISLQARGGALVIDEATRANLELVRTLKDGARNGSLLGVLDRTSTSLGARKLSPLAHRAAGRHPRHRRAPRRGRGALPEGRPARGADRHLEGGVRRRAAVREALAGLGRRPRPERAGPLAGGHAEARRQRSRA